MKNYKMNFETKTLMVTREFADRLMSKSSEEYIENYCLRNNIKDDQLIFTVGERAVQKHLSKVCKNTITRCCIGEV